MSQREIYQQELKRLQEAQKAAKSGYIKADYGKAIRRMKKDLRQYDLFRMEANK